MQMLFPIKVEVLKNPLQRFIEKSIKYIKYKCSVPDILCLKKEKKKKYNYIKIFRMSPILSPQASSRLDVPGTPP